MVKLLADAMLGKLARWLRLLGYDTVYSQAEDALLARQARREGRVLLTSDRELARRRGLRVVLVTSQELSAQLAEVIGAVGPLPAGTPPRCMQCNVPLRPASVAEARPHVPPYVARTQRVFQFCPHCGRFYWKGTHWRKITARLAPLSPADEGHASPSD